MIHGDIAAQLAALEEQRESLMIADFQRLKRSLSGPGGDRGGTSDKLQEAIEASRLRARRRRMRAPMPSYPDELPIVRHRAELAAAIAARPVVVVCGETGSGKSTQLPKICLGLGRGINAMIGQTQPRRLAARSVAARLAEELGVPLGAQVGYKIRFTDRTGSECLLKLMTEGILLEEFRRDRWLYAYDTLIIDEAHERSLNIDILLGLMPDVLKRRPEFRLIISSATIDPRSFSSYFDDAPVIEVSGRSYPVAIRYRPPIPTREGGEPPDLANQILEAVRELEAEAPGDVLIFLPTERDIREVSAFLRGRLAQEVEILPLYGRLDAKSQDRVFAPHAARRLVLATNVAETSLTVPGIRHVVDTGLARISRYSPRSQIQRLPVEPIAQSSAIQRTGRCGRLSDGVCLRLYSEEDYELRPRYTQPEILRTNLAAVILRLLAYRLGDVAAFPFIDPPVQGYVNDGYRLLEELAAVDKKRRLTRLGRKMSRLPVDCRIARMLLAAEAFGCMRELLIIASALSIPDLRERPAAVQGRADKAHARFADQHSDFLWYLNVWEALHKGGRGLKSAQLHRFCRQHYLSHARVLEWRDVHDQLRELCGEQGFALNVQAASYKAVHTALAAGLLGNIGVRDGAQTYRGARGMEFRLFPGSGLRAHPPKWVIAAELAETTRVYARTAARVAPAWILSVAAHVSVRTVFNARWDRRRGRVIADERVSLYGVELLAGRQIDFGRCDPRAAREIFIRAALVEDEFEANIEFLRHNRARVRELEQVEHRARRHDILVAEQARFCFYDERLPQQVRCRRSFKRWAASLDAAELRALCWDRSDLIRTGAELVSAADFPSVIEHRGMRLNLDYRFEPESEADGVTIDMPLAALPQMDPRRFEWLVPGLLAEKIAALMRGLPKRLRRELVPVADHARRAAAELKPSGGGLCESLSRYFHARLGCTIGADDWNPGLLPTYLHMRFRILTKEGLVAAAGRDLDVLRGRLAEQAAKEFRDGLDWKLAQGEFRRWSFEDLPSRLRACSKGHAFEGYPALVDTGSGVLLRVFPGKDRAVRETRAGLRRLIELSLPAQVTFLREHLPHFQSMSLMYLPLGSAEQLRADLVRSVIDRAFLGEPEAIRTRAAFEAACEQGRARMMEVAERLCGLVQEILESRHEIATRMSTMGLRAQQASLRDIKSQIASMLAPGFASATPPEHLDAMPRYLEAIKRRLAKLEYHPARDRAKLAELEPLQQRLGSLSATLLPNSGRLAAFRWMLEEFRVSLFAQELGTAMPVSRKRLERVWQALERDLCGQDGDLVTGGSLGVVR